MRRTDREIKDFKEMLDIIEECETCIIALNTDAEPYIVPLSYGYEVNDDKVTLYFHGAKTGTKYEWMRKNPRASFEMDCVHSFVSDPEKGSCTAFYESVIGKGTMIILDSIEEKTKALRLIMNHYHKEIYPFNEKLFEATTAFKLDIDTMTAKAHR